MKDLIDFTKDILRRYNATPDEWDAFESARWASQTTHRITAVFYPQRGEVEATWEHTGSGKVAAVSFPVTPDQGEDIAEVVMPCVEQKCWVKGPCKALSVLQDAVDWIEDDRFDDEYIGEDWYHDAKKVLSEKGK